MKGNKICMYYTAYTIPVKENRAKAKRDDFPNFLLDP